MHSQTLKTGNGSLYSNRKMDKCPNVAFESSQVSLFPKLRFWLKRWYSLNTVLLYQPLRFFGQCSVGSVKLFNLEKESQIAK